jgi:hypothetical protein
MSFSQSGTPQLSLWACFGKSRPVQTQPGQTCWIESTRPSGSDIGNVKERTSACEASVLLYNFWVKQREELTQCSEDVQADIIVEANITWETRGV